MPGVTLVARSHMRRRWVGVAALTVLVGLVGAVTMAAFAGARRSDRALARFQAFSRPSDLEITVGTDPTPAQLRALRRTPGVADVAELAGVGLLVERAPELDAIAASIDGRLGRVVDRARIVAGRRADPRRADEVTISEALAAQLHVGVGDTFSASSYSPAQTTLAVTTGGDPGPRAGPTVRLRVVGIDRRPLDLGVRGATGGVLILTPAFDRTFVGKTIGTFGNTFRIRTRLGRPDRPRVVAAARKIFADAAYIQVTPLDIETEGAGSAIGVLTAALWVFGAVVALAGIVAVTIIMTRETALASVDDDVLRSLGLTRVQRALGLAVPGVLVAFGGAVVALIGAMVLSPLFPIGIARRADPDVGLHFDALVLFAGFAAVIAIMLGITMVAAARATAPVAVDPARADASRLERRIGQSRLAPSTTTGIRMAIDRGAGRHAVPVRSAYLGAAVGIVGVTAVLMFGANVTHLATTRRLFGWTFDAAITDGGATTCRTRGSSDGITRWHGVSAVAEVCTQTVQIGSTSVTAESFASLHGRIDAPIADGRAPRNAREVALGAQTMRDTGTGVGDTVVVRGPGSSARYLVVGRAVFAEISVGGQPLANGAVFTHAGLVRVYDSSNGTRLIAVRFAPGANRGALVHRIDAFVDQHDQLGPVALPHVPAEVSRLQQIGWFPVTLAALLGVLALLAIGHALATSVRRRRKDLAVLKTLGFDRGQVRAVITAQATTIGVLGLVIGLPLGLIVGSVVWQRVAEGIGVDATPTVPVLVVGAVAVAALVLVNAVAFVPARAAAATNPGASLRTE